MCCAGSCAAPCAMPTSRRGRSADASLVGALVKEMGGAYPELLRAQPLIEETLLREETRFRQTLDKGLRLLDEATTGMAQGDVLPGETRSGSMTPSAFPMT
jgi:alanyl-tRNA synthetase